MHEKCGTVLGLSLLIFWYHLFILLRFTFFLSLFPLSNYAANFTIIFKCATSHECRIFSRYISLELFYFKIIIKKKTCYEARTFLFFFAKTIYQSHKHYGIACLSLFKAASSSWLEIVHVPHILSIHLSQIL